MSAGQSIEVGLPTHSSRTISAGAVTQASQARFEVHPRTNADVARCRPADAIKDLGRIKRSGQANKLDLSST